MSEADLSIFRDRIAGLSKKFVKFGGILHDLTILYGRIEATGTEFKENLEKLLLLEDFANFFNNFILPNEFESALGSTIEKVIEAQKKELNDKSKKYHREAQEETLAWFEDILNGKLHTISDESRKVLKEKHAELLKKMEN